MAAAEAATMPTEAASMTTAPTTMTSAVLRPHGHREHKGERRNGCQTPHTSPV